jgi:hypothetical protein
MEGERLRSLQVFLLVAGVLLLGQGTASLVLDWAGGQLPPLLQAFVADPLHATIHVAWGLVMLGVLGARGGDRRVLAALALAFGVFYTGLAFLGVFVHHPFGLRLGPGEDAFHFLVGPAALLLGGRVLWTPRAGPASLSAVTQNTPRGT